MRRLLATGAMLGAAVIVPATVLTTALRADDRVYHDRDANDDHRWDRHEDRAYRIWLHENHRAYRDFARMREEDRRAYWHWRHEHSDAVLHIDIR